ncbi:MAG: phosphoribosylformylglycinamidine synthase, partial [Candidatus Aenigmatarchaeota archaeon]
VPWEGIPQQAQPRFVLNESGIFESRFVSVAIQPSPSIMLKGMEGSTLGIWVAHGEGRCIWPDGNILNRALKKGLAPIRFVEEDGEVTQKYPFNPNGSAVGITGLCSEDGRHLALMPHPERLFQRWQWPYWPDAWSHIHDSPWLRMFQNAREWCTDNS